MAERVRFPARTGIATLTARERLTPRMIRVTLRADEFRDGWPIQQPGEILTLLFAPPGEEIVLPLQGWVFPPDAPEQEWRNYTVRRHDPAPGRDRRRRRPARAARPRLHLGERARPRRARRLRRPARRLPAP